MTAGARFGHCLRATRKTKKLKIAQLAERAGTGVKHLGRIERGEKLPSFDLIIALAEAMNVSPATFFELKDPERDPRVLRKKLQRLLDLLDGEQLRLAHRVFSALFEP
jgi:transcriptional regulator with XRE-family HTH domain